MKSHGDVEWQREDTNSYVAWVLLPVRGGGIAVCNAGYHNGVFQPRRHVHHLLVYHRRHGAPYLCRQKKRKDRINPPATIRHRNVADKEPGDDSSMREIIKKPSLALHKPTSSREEKLSRNFLDSGGSEASPSNISPGGRICAPRDEFA